MKLYYKAGACSLSPHIALLEAGLKFDLEAVDFQTGKTASGADFNKMNPKGYIPALQLNSGELITEGAVIVQYIADQKPELKLLPPAGSMERYRAQEWLNYIATEIHKGFSPLFGTDAPDAYKAALKDKLGKRLDLVNQNLTKHNYMLGDNFSVVDAYLFTVLSWAPYVKLDLSPFAALQQFSERMNKRPKVQEAMKAEGLLK